MKIIFVSSEIVPFASTGGLGDVCAALPKALVEQGVDVISIMPLYGQINRDKFKLEPCDVELRVPLGKRSYRGRVWKQSFDGVTTYFIHNPEFFDRDGLYSDTDLGYTDNFERFLFFQKAVVMLIDEWDLKPDVVHCNDWQTGLIPMLLYHGVDGRFRNGMEKTLITIHNLAHQGWAAREKFILTQLPDSCYTMQTLEFYGEINALKGGLVSASAITAVSPNYAEEIKTPKFGFRLEGVLRHRSRVLHGILNGIDYDRWNPDTDPHIAATYSLTDLAGKATCKAALQKAASFKVDPNVPLLGMITRLDRQKGIDLLVGAVEDIIATGAQLIILGTGDERYEAACLEWSRKWPDQICSWIEFSSEKAHQIEAGADLFLMPSEFEPCGQNQLYSFRYGTVPVVHGIGGLEDSVMDYTGRGGTGFKFYGHTSSDFSRCLRRALDVYQDDKQWEALVKRGMKQDFSVVHMARDYIALYRKILSGNETVD
jgi:starch synthase